MRADLHIHTNYSFDSKATARQYIDMAIQRGVKVLCFTDHIEANQLFNTFNDFQFERRAREFGELKQEYKGQVLILSGVEFGEPHLHPKELQFVNSLGLDMIIGSVHYPLDYNMFVKKDCSRREYERIYDSFVYDMVSAGGFDVLGHIDLPKRYHDDYVEDIDQLRRSMEMCVRQGIVPEINTSSLRKGLAHPMPALSLVEYYAQHGGKYVTVNSDSHAAIDLNTDFDSVTSQLPSGVQCCCFVNRKLVPLGELKI